MAFDPESHAHITRSASGQSQRGESAQRPNPSWAMDPPTYRSETGDTRYRFPTSPDRPPSVSSLRIVSDSPSTSNAQLPDKPAYYSDVTFPPAKSPTSHSFSSGGTFHVNRPSPDHRHSAPDQDARNFHMHGHQRRMSSLGVRKGIDSRRASLPTHPTTLHHSRNSRFWRTVLQDNPVIERPRFLSSARGPASRLDHDLAVSSQSSASGSQFLRPGSPQLWRTSISSSNRIDIPQSSYTRAISESQTAQNIYPGPKSYPAIPPLVFKPPSRTWRTSLPDFALSSPREGYGRGVGHVGSHPSDLSSLSGKVDDDYDDETDGDDQFESQVEVGESEVESESDAESASDVEFEDRAEGSLQSEEQFYDHQRRVKHPRNNFASAGSSSSPTMERANAESLRIIRVADLGPSPANPSAIVTEDRRYPCPHLGAYILADVSASRYAYPH